MGTHRVKGKLPFAIAAIISCYATPARPDSLPVWWSTRHLIKSDAVPDDYAVANVGQLKTVAAAAAAQFDYIWAGTAGGAGPVIHTLISGWSNVSGADDYAACTTGQAKSVAILYYQRLEALSLPHALPWTAVLGDDSDYSPINLGQLKTVFGFELPSAPVTDNSSTLDSDGDGIPDIVEINLTHTNPHNPDTDGDGIIDATDADPNDPTNSNGIHVVIYSPAVGEIIR